MTHPNHPAFATGTDNWNQEGLTKREYFAAMAMQSLILKDPNKPLFDVRISNDSVMMADSLINALNNYKP
jgi:hypothetical protein